MTDNGHKVAVLEKPFHNRVVGSGVERIDDLLANPANWRLHPDNQQRALAGVIDDIGFIRSITVNKTTGCVLDGHLRVALASRSGVKELPVEYVELSEDEEAIALLLLDPIAAMAAADKAKLDELMQSINSDDPRVQEMMERIGVLNGLLDQVNYEEEWTGMPEFEMTSDKYRSIIVHFASQDDLENFCSTIGQDVTDKTKFIWYPEKEKANMKDYIFENKDEI